MKTLFITFLLATLPIITQVNTTVSISGDINLRPGETTMLNVSVSPYNSSYTFEWDFDDIDKVEKQYSYSISGSSITITHLNVTQYGLLNVYCRVYDASGNYVGTGETEIVVMPNWPN